MHDATDARDAAQHGEGEHVRTWTGGDFRLDLWDTGRTDPLGKSILRYRLTDREPWGEVFAGADFACSPLHSIDGDAAVAAVLGFLSLRPGDTDADYFAGYTAHQLAWRDERAEELGMLALELEESVRGAPDNYTTVPPGRYAVTVRDVRAGQTRGGDVRWSLELEIAEGEHAGRLAAWDAIVFSTRGRMRVRRVFQALGVPVPGKVSVEPGELVGRTAVVEIRHAQYVTPDGGSVVRNEVPSDGWSSATEGKR